MHSCRIPQQSRCSWNTNYF